MIHTKKASSHASSLDEFELDCTYRRDAEDTPKSGKANSVSASCLLRELWMNHYVWNGIRVEDFIAKCEDDEGCWKESIGCVTLTRETIGWIIEYSQLLELLPITKYTAIG